MEYPITKLLSELNPSFYVIECMPNMYPPNLVSSNTIPLVDTIRERQPGTPIVLVDLFSSPLTNLDSNMKDGTEEMNNALRTEYEKMIDNGYENIFYLETKSALGQDYEGTVDAIHFTDLGFTRYSNFLIKKFKEFNLIEN